MKTEAQCKQILRYLRTGRSITPIEALRCFQSFRLAARVRDLRDAGYNIITTMKDDGEKRYASYKLGRMV